MTADHDPGSSNAGRVAHRLVRSALSEVRDANCDVLTSLDAGIASVPENEFGGTQPQSIPGYDLCREIHRGGQGVVFEATQRSTARRVAIKITRGGAFATVGEGVRFDREVRLLAQLNHPNIVAIHDSGSVASAAYFVMDYIDGTPLDQYIEHHRPSVGDTVRLFVAVCGAVNAAHRKGIIHRDLKPGNIRVDSSGSPHVLDFGLAKSLGDSLASDFASHPTNVGEFVGSLPWASPEQINGDQEGVDVRTDVYALGVMCYHALTGRFPYEVNGSVRDVMDRILTNAPSRPSAYCKRIDDDLDTIILKCLEKEPDRRYQSAGDLGQDLRLYLAGEPIIAKRNSTAYWLRKKLRRHWGATIAGVTFFATLVASTIWIALLYKRAEAQAHIARAEEAKFRAAGEVIGKSFSLVSYGDFGSTVRFNDVLTKLHGQAEVIAPKQPLVAAVVMQTLGDTYQAEGRYDDAWRSYDRACALRLPLLGSNHPDSILLRIRMGAADLSRGEKERARPLIQDSVEKLERLRSSNPAELAEALIVLGTLCAQDKAIARGQRACRDALKLVSFDNPDQRDKVVAAWMGLGELAAAGEMWGDAIHAFETGLPMARETFGEFGPYTVVAMNNLAYCYQVAGRPDEALRLSTDTITKAREKLCDDPQLFVTLLLYASSLPFYSGRVEQAESLTREALSIATTRLGDTDPLTAVAKIQLSQMWQSGDGRPLPAVIPLLREALPPLETAPPISKTYAHIGMYTLAAALIDKQANRATTDANSDEVMEARSLLIRRWAALDDPSLDSLHARRQTAWDLALACDLLEDQSDEALEFVRLACEDTDCEPWGHLLMQFRLLRTLVRRGDIEEALELWAELAPLSLKHSAHVRCDGLKTEAQLRIAERRFEDAEKLLAEAECLFAETENVEAVRALKRIGRLRERLYNAWNSVYPGQGFSEKAAEWRRWADVPAY